jgi:hypothetical protein
MKRVVDAFKGLLTVAPPFLIALQGSLLCHVNHSARSGFSGKMRIAGINSTCRKRVRLTSWFKELARSALKAKGIEPKG